MSSVYCRGCLVRGVYGSLGWKPELFRGNSSEEIETLYCAVSVVLSYSSNASFESVLLLAIKSGRVVTQGSQYDERLMSQEWSLYDSYYRVAAWHSGHTAEWYRFKPLWLLRQCKCLQLRPTGPICDGEETCATTKTSGRVGPFIFGCVPSVPSFYIVLMVLMV